MQNHHIMGAIGSSPRLRGTLSCIIRNTCSNRFIPTLAGNTGVHIESTPEKPVHPHACGEHLQRRGCGSKLFGSSPRLRGTQIAFNHQLSDARFIPTLAGNTLLISPPILMSTVHPHACGEHIYTALLMSIPDGSSPRLRGTLVLYQVF